ncbi:MAG: SDR family oxidoreductase [Clostridia bacterium]|nr:SDR family oxidoreductase [Clostridia bacterium]
MEFKNKTVIVTGASIGLGKQTAIEFAQKGATVCIVDIDAERLKLVKDQIEALGAKASAYVCDVGNEAQVKEVVDDIIKIYGKIDILVNNAGLWRTWGTFVETTSDDWKKKINVNILGVMYFSHKVLPNMIENKFGRIINIGSVAGVYGNANMVDYSMTKGAVSSFTKALAKEVAEYGITVNNVVPGTIRNEDAQEETPLCYMGRTGKLEEFAYLISFLASDKAAYISGQDYQIDGCRKKI